MVKIEGEGYEKSIRNFFERIQHFYNNILKIKCNEGKFGSYENKVGILKLSRRAIQ